jgi:hypothetical protein
MLDNGRKFLGIKNNALHYMPQKVKDDKVDEVFSLPALYSIIFFQSFS